MRGVDSASKPFTLLLVERIQQLPLVHVGARDQVPVRAVDHLHARPIRPRQREDVQTRDQAPRRVRVPQVVDSPGLDAGRLKRRRPRPVPEVLHQTLSGVTTGGVPGAVYTARGAGSWVMFRGGCDGLGDHLRRDGRVDHPAQVLKQAQCLGGSWSDRASRRLVRSSSG
jgi:hypothetical protein